MATTRIWEHFRSSGDRVRIGVRSSNNLTVFSIHVPDETVHTRTEDDWEGRVSEAVERLFPGCITVFRMVVAGREVATLPDKNPHGLN